MKVKEFISSLITYGLLDTLPTLGGLVHEVAEEN